MSDDVTTKTNAVLSLQQQVADAQAALDALGPGNRDVMKLKTADDLLTAARWDAACQRRDALVTQAQTAYAALVAAVQAT